jgi:sarcosine oxidase, subunit gamma
MSDEVRIRPMGPLTQVDVRFDPGDSALVERLERAMTAAPPLEPNTTSAAADGEGHWLWLGPDEWLIVGLEGVGEEVGPAIEAAARSAAGDALITTVDVSANRVGLEVAGSGARDLLAFGCSLDLDPPTFGPGRCAQTNVARAGVILWQVDDGPRYRLLVRPSFAAYLQAWLEDAQSGLG